MYLRLVHTADSQFTSRYDLVQVVPIWSGATYSGGLFNPGSMMPVIQSDVNFDGVVDSYDLVQFLAAFEESSPAADVTLDDQVDMADLLAFLEHYTQGD